MLKLTKEQIDGLLSRQKNVLSGYYNNNYKVEYQGIPYIFRIPIDNAASMDMRFIEEETVLDFLARYKEIAAPCVEMNEVYGGQKYFFHSFIEGDTIEDIYPESSVMPDWMIERIAETVIALHRIPLEQIGHFADKMPWDLNTAEFYRHVFNYNKGLIEKYSGTYREIYDYFGMPETIDVWLKDRHDEVQDAPFVLAHADIHRKNVIVNQKNQSATIIDWELALIAASFYDIAIHFHKMRYIPQQEKTFLDIYCNAFKLDKDFVVKQVHLYKDIEEVKSVAIDVVRYLDIINDVSEDQVLSNAKRYHQKLQKAYICWNKDPKSITQERIISFFLSKRMA